MKHLFTLLSYTVLFSLPFGGVQNAAMAQDCGIQVESITRLKRPEFSSLSAWDFTVGEDGFDRFQDIIFVNEQEFVAVGDYTIDEEDQVYKPFITKMTRRNDIVWDNREETKEGFQPHRVLQKPKGGFSVFGETTVNGGNSALYLAHYDDDGERVSRKIIQDKSGHLTPRAMDYIAGKKGVVVAAQFTDKQDAQKTYGVIYKLSHKGEVVWRRDFQPGNATTFFDVHTNPDGSYMVSGQIRLDDGRMAGWAVRLTDRGAIDWQQSYPRGRNAGLRAAQNIRDGGFVFTGDVEPSGGGRKSAWVMAVGPVGDVIWQRYYTADYNYIGHDVVSYEDGRVEALIAGKPLNGRRSTPHVRVLTLSPRGFLMNVSNYTEGQGAGAKRMILDHQKNRVFVGTAQTRAPANVPVGALPPHTFDAWVVGLPSLEVYNDPCMVNPLDDIRPVIKSPF